MPLETLALSIKRLQHRNYRTLDARLAPLGISLVQWGALREIALHPGVCMHHLAELTFNSDQAFGMLMARLLRHKLVERQPGVGRANVHRLTPRGKALLGAGHRLVRQVLSKTFAALDAGERARLQGLLAKVLGDGDPEATTLSSPSLCESPGNRVTKRSGALPGPKRIAIRASRRPREKTSGRAPAARNRKTPAPRGGAN